MVKNNYCASCSFITIMLALVGLISTSCSDVEGPDFVNYLSPRAVADTPDSPSSGIVTFNFHLIDREKDVADVEIEYSANLGSTWHSCTLANSSETIGLTTGWWPGETHSVNWNSAADLIGMSNNAAVILRVKPSDAGNANGSEGQTSVFTVNNTAYNTAPSVSITTPSGVKLGDVKIDYSLLDIESDNCSIIMHYSDNGGASWKIATLSSAGDGIINLTSSTSGIAHVVFWDSLADGVAMTAQEDDIRVRILPLDSFNMGTAVATNNFSVNNLDINYPPTVTITSGPANGSTITVKSASFTWSGSDSDGTVAGYYYSLDSITPSTFITQTTVTFDNLSNAEHTFRICAIDNESALSDIAARTFTVNFTNQQPTVTILSGPTNGSTITVTYAAFTWTGADNDGTIAGYYYSMDNDPPDVYTTQTTNTFYGLSNAAHVFRVCSVDNEGASSSTQARTFTVNHVNQQPTVTITGGPSGNTSNTQPTFTYSGADNDGIISGYYIDIDNPSPDNWTTLASWTPSAPIALGAHTFYVQSKDNEGAVSTIASRIFTVIEPANGSTVINEDFSDGTLDLPFVAIKTGNVTFNISGGILTMDMSGVATDSGLIVLTDHLDETKPMLLKTRIRGSNISGTSSANFALGENTSASGILGGFDGQIFVVQGNDGKILIDYNDNLNGDHSWNAQTSSWISADPSKSYQGVVGSYYTLEFHSDGTQWYIVLRDSSENLILQTTPITWSGTRNIAGKDYQFYFGEWSTGYYYADQDIDYIYADYFSK
jgi:hypothetical protein